MTSSHGLSGIWLHSLSGAWPKMRWKQMTCPIDGCDEVFFVYYINRGMCPVHRWGPTAEPWSEPSYLKVPQN